MKKLVLFLSALLISNTSFSQIINTIAGGGEIANNVPATSAQLSNPSGLIMDANGNIYFSDPGFSIIRKISLSGIITIYAGNGTIAYTGDGGPATQASMQGPIGVAIDQNSNIYFADQNHNVIRKISNTGIISTYAGTGVAGFSGDGGLATAAQFNGPMGIACDAAGNVFVADFNNNRIRKISTSGIISTVAGNGIKGYAGDGGNAVSARLNNPIEVTFDAAGDLYISDTYNFRVRKVNSSGIISTFAGNGFPGSSGDGGLATGASFIPVGICFDNSGNFYLSDYIGNKIRKVVPTGTITTICGTTNGFSGDGGPATAAQINKPLDVYADAVGNIFVCDNGNARVRKIDASGNIQTIAGTSPSSLNNYATNVRLQASHVAFNRSTGHVLFSSTFKNVVQAVYPNTGRISTIAGTGSAGFSGDGGPATAALVDSVGAIAIDTSGIYIADAGNDRIRKVDKYGIITTIAGTGTQGFSGDGGLAINADLKHPAAVAVRKNKLYIGDVRNKRIRKVDLATGIITTIAGNGVLGYSGDGGLATSASIGEVYNIAVDTAENVYYTDETFHVIRKISTTGTITTICGTGVGGFSGDGGQATLAQTKHPTGLTIDDNNNIYFTEYLNHRLRKINAFGIISTLAGNGTATYGGDGGSAVLSQLSSPLGMSVDAKGNSIYFSDGGNNRIRVISNVPSPDICIATVDSLSKDNIIIWDKSAYFNVDSFIVYREVSSNPVLYSRIGAIPQTALSQFIDTNRVYYSQNTLPNGDPQISTYRYKIQIMDKDRNCSFMSKYHNTIYVNNISGNFIWNTYDVEGSPSPVSGYVLLRDNIGNGNWIVVGTTSGSQNNLSDPNYSSFQATADWRVEALGFSCVPVLKSNSPTGGYVKSKSNIRNNKMIGVNEIGVFAGKVSVYPNPTENEVTIDLKDWKNEVHVEVTNTLGVTVLTRDFSSDQNTLNLSSLNQGIYFITLKSDKQAQTFKIVKN